DSQMYEHIATQTNLQTLESRGVLVVGPESGRLASGHMGAGRLSETAWIVGAVRYAIGRRLGDFVGKRLVVTAGGTQEPIDPVRYIGNHSSGKMGYALAEAGRDRGAQVTLVSAAPSERPYGVEVVPVRRAQEMRDAVVSACRDADALIMAAAVADYRPEDTAPDKIKRNQPELDLSLVKTPDILAELAGEQRLVKVGFAAESRDLVENASQKLKAKGVHLIVANDVTKEGSGFGTETNEVVLLDIEGGREDLPLMSKYEVSQRILDRVRRWLD
ncbi:MAG TPA: bifunctional phosphopantothenoylcysteine decarboxylase/phosphopantothenate--cysteine ligase CoaBC, partial [Dehalococcoidia bacterium]|nr:bifunctional phosphopantothenoylcysteine decarboxylase/phosphopantothenate--cysteine ligase CoaBC [Dehalococcoidia bacterium]